MQDNPTLREVAQAVSTWLTTQSQALTTWLHSWGDLRVQTLGVALLIGFVVLYGLVFVARMGYVAVRTGDYRRRGYP